MCTASKKALIINDAQKDPRFFRGIDQVTGPYTTKSILAVLMKTPSGRRPWRDPGSQQQRRQFRSGRPDGGFR